MSANTEEEEGQGGRGGRRGGGAASTTRGAHLSGLGTLTSHGDGDSAVPGLDGARDASAEDGSGTCASNICEKPLDSLLSAFWQTCKTTEWCMQKKGNRRATARAPWHQMRHHCARARLQDVQPVCGCACA
jgi:hypothetical protein